MHLDIIIYKNRFIEGNQNSNQPPQEIGVKLNTFRIGTANYGTGNNGGWKAANNLAPNRNNILINTSTVYKEPGISFETETGTKGEIPETDGIYDAYIANFQIKAPVYKEYNNGGVSDTEQILEMENGNNNIAKITETTSNSSNYIRPDDKITFKKPGVYKIDYIYVDRINNPTAEPYIVGSRWTC